MEIVNGSKNPKGILIDYLEEVLDICVQNVLKNMIYNLSAERISKIKEKIANDITFTYFGNDSDQWVMIRALTSINISKGRNFGTFFEKTMRSLVSYAIFGDDFSREKIDSCEKKFRMTFFKEDGAISSSRLKKKGRGETYGIDCAFYLDLISDIAMKGRLKSFISSTTGSDSYEGVAIEVKFAFQPNDASRINKDIDFCKILEKNKFFPLYLVLSSDNTRDDTIKTLQLAGWTYVMGKDTLKFIKMLTSVDLVSDFLEKDTVKTKIRNLQNTFELLIKKTFNISLGIKKIETFSKGRKKKSTTLFRYIS